MTTTEQIAVEELIKKLIKENIRIFVNRERDETNFVNVSLYWGDELVDTHSAEISLDGGTILY